MVKVENNIFCVWDIQSSFSAYCLINVQSSLCFWKMETILKNVIPKTQENLCCAENSQILFHSSFLPRVDTIQVNVYIK